MYSWGLNTTQITLTIRPQFSSLNQEIQQVNLGRNGKIHLEQLDNNNNLYNRQ